MMDKFKSKNIFKIYEQVQNEIKNKVLNSGGQSQDTDGKDQENKLNHAQMIERFNEYVHEFMNKDLGRQEGYLDPSNFDRCDGLPSKVKDFTV